MSAISAPPQPHLSHLSSISAKPSQPHLNHLGHGNLCNWQKSMKSLWHTQKLRKTKKIYEKRYKSMEIYTNPTLRHCASAAEANALLNPPPPGQQAANALNLCCLSSTSKNTPFQRPSTHRETEFIPLSIPIPTARRLHPYLHPHPHPHPIHIPSTNTTPNASPSHLHPISIPVTSPLWSPHHTIPIPSTLH